MIGYGDFAFIAGFSRKPLSCSKGYPIEVPKVKGFPRSLSADKAQQRATLIIGRWGGFL